MAEDQEGPRPKRSHVIGEALDTLSIQEFDERMALLRTEIERLETAKRQKQVALDQAGSIFKR